jgi:hypothetical protein
VQLHTPSAERLHIQQKQNMENEKLEMFRLKYLDDLTISKEMDVVSRNLSVLLFNLFHPSLEVERHRALKKALKYSKMKEYAVIMAEMRYIEIFYDLLVEDLHIEMVLGVLANLACFGNFGVKMVEMNILYLLNPLLCSDKHQVVEYCCSLIGNIAGGDPMRMEILRCGAIPPLVALLSNDLETIRESAVWALSNLTSPPSLISVLYECGTIPYLVRSLESENERIQAYACVILCSMSSSYALRDTIAAANAIEPLLCLVSPHSVFEPNRPQQTRLITTRCHAACTIANLAWSYPLRQTIMLTQEDCEYGLLSDLVDMLHLVDLIESSPRGDCSEIDDGDDTSLLRTGLILSAVEGAARALSNIALTDLYRSRIQHAGALSPLVSLLSLSLHGDQHGGVAAVIGAAASALSNLAKAYTLMEPICEAGAIAGLYHVLSSPYEVWGGVGHGDEAREYAAEALGHLAFTEQIRLLIWNSGAVPYLVSMCETIPSSSSSSPSSVSSVQCATMTLAHLSESPSIHLPLYNLHAIDNMVQILLSKTMSCRCKEYAATVIANLARTASIRDDILQSPRVVSTLYQSSLSGNSNEVINAANQVLQMYPNVRSRYGNWKDWFLETLGSYIYPAIGQEEATT